MVQMLVFEVHLMSEESLLQLKNSTGHQVGMEQVFVVCGPVTVTALNHCTIYLQSSTGTFIARLIEFIVYYRILYLHIIKSVKITNIQHSLVIVRVTSRKNYISGT